jgi:hypothetical protein
MRLSARSITGFQDNENQPDVEGREFIRRIQGENISPPRNGRLENRVGIGVSFASFRAFMTRLSFAILAAFAFAICACERHPIDGQTVVTSTHGSGGGHGDDHGHGDHGSHGKKDAVHAQDEAHGKADAHGGAKSAVPEHK